MKFLVPKFPVAEFSSVKFPAAKLHAVKYPTTKFIAAKFLVVKFVVYANMKQILRLDNFCEKLAIAPFFQNLMNFKENLRISWDLTIFNRKNWKNFL